MTSVESFVKHSTYITMGAIVVLGVAGGATLRFSMKTPQPRILIESDVQDLGVVPTLSLQTGEFNIRNAGKAPLQVEISNVSCSCTVPITDDLDIPPGQSASIPFEFHVGGREEHVGSTIVLSTNDPLNPSVTLGITGKAAAVLNLSRSTINLGSLKRTDLPARAEFSIRTGQLWITDSLDGIHLTCDVPYVDLKIDRSQTQIIAEVTIKDNAPNGILRKHLSLSFDSLPDYIFEVPIILELKGKYRVSPPQLHFGTVAPGKTKRSEIRITTNSDSSQIGFVEIIHVPEKLFGILDVELIHRDDYFLILSQLMGHALPGAPEVVEEALLVQVGTPDKKFIEHLEIPIMAILK